MNKSDRKLISAFIKRYEDVRCLAGVENYGIDYVQHAMKVVNRLVNNVRHDFDTAKTTSVLFAGTMMESGNKVGKSFQEAIGIGIWRFKQTIIHLEDQVYGLGNLDEDLIEKLIRNHREPHTDEDSLEETIVKDVYNLLEGNFDNLKLEESKDIIDYVNRLN